MSTIRKYAASTTALDDRTVVATISDGTVDRVGDVLDPAGCDFASYKRNPVVLAMHDPASPVGNTDIWTTADAVMARIKFAARGVSAKADELCALVKAGVISGVSVGFTPVEREPRKGGGWLYKKWQLLECSFVSVPANENALVLQRGFGIIKPRPSMFGRGHVSFETDAAFCARKRAELEARALAPWLLKWGLAAFLGSILRVAGNAPRP